MPRSKNQPNQTRHLNQLLLIPKETFPQINQHLNQPLLNP